MADIKVLLIEQEDAIYRLSRFVPNFKKLGKQNFTEQRVNTRLCEFRKLMNEVRSRHATISAYAAEDIRNSHPYFLNKKYSECSDRFDDDESFLEGLLPTAPSETAPTIVTSSVSKPPVKLPTIQLPTFHGSYREWESFRDRFTALIKANPRLSDSDRMQYLSSAVKGTASDAIKHVPLTEAGFDLAWTILTHRYENKRHLVLNHIQDLFSLPTVRPKSAESLRSFRDSVLLSREALRRLGRPVEQWDDFFLYLVNNRLDWASKEAWESSISDNNELPSFKVIDDFLQSRIRVVESMFPANDPTSRPSISGRQHLSKVASHAATSSAAKCTFCQKTWHLLKDCSGFMTASVERRNEFVQHDHRCVNCLSLSHATNQCPSTHRCRRCGGRHHTLLHKETVPQVVSHLAATHCCQTPSVLLATATIKVFAPSGRTAVIRALLDQGSEATLISERLAQLLRAPRHHQTNSVEGIGGLPTMSHFTTHLGIGAVADEAPAQTIRAVILKTLTRFKPHRLTALSRWPHLTNLTLADSSATHGSAIDLILGADVYGSLLRGGLRQGGIGEPTAQDTIFGWVLSGPMHKPKRSGVITTHVSTLTRLDDSLRKFWEVEDIPAADLLSPQERRCEEHFVRTHSRAADGRYIVRLPFTSDPPISFGDSRSSAVAHLRRMEARLRREPPKEAAYREFMAEYQSHDHMRLAPPTPASGAYYIPHHAVYRDDHATSKIRVVFDASHVPNGGTSLNQALSPGPKLQTDLSAIIIRWRQYKYVCTADVSKMYRQIRVDSRDVNYQRIVWRNNPSLAIQDYQLLTVTYGTSSAPYLALRVLQQLVQDEGAAFPLAASVLCHQTYVDDCLFGAQHEEELMSTRAQLIALMKKGGFHLHKWGSNVNILPCPSDTDPSDRPIKMDTHQKVLGIVWSPASDTFKFTYMPSTTPPMTKRAVVSTIARLFDPLGWLTPVTVSAKIIIQQLWLDSCEWDAPLAEHRVESWLRLWKDLVAVTELHIPRWTSCDSSQTLQLHGFADASIKAYAAVVYLRVTSPAGHTRSTLIAAKSRVAPIKALSVPRLELCAALLLARLVEFVRQSLQTSTLSVTCWSDSRVVLAWLAQPPVRWKTFVANRVSAIQDLVGHECWRHVPTDSNPADCASRGVTASELKVHPLWWTGPSWLGLGEPSWPAAPESPPPLACLSEQRSIAVASCSLSTGWDLSKRYSSWSKLLNITALILRATHRMRRRSPVAGSITLHRAQAKQYWLRTIQKELFPLEYAQLAASRPVHKAGPLVSLVPFLDETGLIRARGRLRRSPLPGTAKYPIILKTHPLVKLLIQAVHLQQLHGSPGLVLASLRQEYWILRARPLIRSVIHHCLPCCKLTASVAEQIMSDLPECRVTATSRAFIHTGMDYAGPIAIKDRPGRGQRSHKAYIAVFVCMTVKAIHIEVVSDYSSQAFLAALRRFTARRGWPSHFYSDNGTTFKGAERELRHQLEQSQLNAQHECATQSAEWHFMPPAAPHFGGLWEAAVKSLKYHLKRTIGTHVLTFEELTTLLCRIEGSLNSRPLASLSDDLDDYQCLTPGHFLIGTPLTAAPEPSVLDCSENRLSRWQMVQRLHETIWLAWKRDYLHTLQQRPKWRQMQQLLQCGQLVLLKDTRLPSSQWPLGRITRCHPGDDGMVRVVTVKTCSAEYVRPIAKICPLPIPINIASEESSAASIA